MIVAHGLDAKQSDQHQLAPIVDAIEANLGRKPAQLLADAGYCSDANGGVRATRRRRLYRPRGGPSTRGKEKAAARASPPCAEKIRAGGNERPRSLEQATARAGVRTDQAGARLPPVPLARRREGRRRMGPRSSRPQYPEARSAAGLRFRRSRNGISLANRKPAAKNGQIAYAHASNPIAPRVKQRLLSRPSPRPPFLLARDLAPAQPPCEGWNKTTCCIREVGTELRERGTRAPGLALLGTVGTAPEVSCASRAETVRSSPLPRWGFVTLFPVSVVRHWSAFCKSGYVAARFMRGRSPWFRLRVDKVSR